ncbi:hypothetical protein PybrP1_011562, partial [[Pythium] brassicae (nom. inval.)]
AAAAPAAPASTEPPDKASALASHPPSSPPSAEPPLQQPSCAPPEPETPPHSPLVVAAAVPAETHFASREQLLAHVHAFTLRHGYAVVIQKSNVPRGQLWLRCDLGGSYRSTAGAGTSTSTGAAPPGESRKRKSSSRLRNCPFQLYARRLPDARWLLKVQNAAHNHEVDPEQLVAHPAARRLSLAQKQLVDELTGLGARPAHIVEKLKEQFPDKPVKVQDIYNARNYIRRERGAGRVPFSQRHAGSSGQDEEEAEEEEDDDDEEDGGGDEDKKGGVATEAPATVAIATASVVQHHQQHPSTVSSTRSSSSSSSSPRGHATSSARLQALLQDASAQFPAWQPRAQKQFLFQFEVLLAKCSKAAAAKATTTAASAKQEPQLQCERQAGEEEAEEEAEASATDSTSSSSSRSRSVDALAVAPGSSASPSAASSAAVAAASGAAPLLLLPESAL